MKVLKPTFALICCLIFRAFKSAEVQKSPRFFTNGFNLRTIINKIVRSEKFKCVFIKALGLNVVGRRYCPSAFLKERSIFRAFRSAKVHKNFFKLKIVGAEKFKCVFIKALGFNVVGCR